MASFSAVLTDFNGDPADLRYRWSLSYGRGDLANGSTSLGVQVDAGQAIGCVGKEKGIEEINVLIFDANNQVIGDASLAFEIVPAVDASGVSRGCFDQPKFIYSKGSSHYVVNYDGTGEEYLGVSGTGFSTISPDGEWIAWTVDSVEGWDMHVQRCNGSERRKIEGGTSEDFTAKFSPDSKTLYFLRPEPSQEKPSNAGRPLEIAAYDMETEALRFLTKVHETEERVRDFTVNPLTGRSPSSDRALSISKMDHTRCIPYSLSFSRKVG